MYSWIIIGGGVHGVHLAARLIGEAELPAESLCIVDPGERLLERWHSCTSVTGMRHLRSPAVHHLALDPWSLRRFAGKRKNRRAGVFAPPYDRPSVELFDEHCQRVIAEYELESRHIEAWATKCRVNCDKVEVSTNDGEALRGENVLLAIGASEQPHFPGWAKQDDPRVEHVFARGFSFPCDEPRTSFAVVGGGISAAQIAIRLANAGHETHLISRHEWRKHQFDSDPGWLGPKYMSWFEQERSPERRRNIIQGARNRGSVSPDVYHSVRTMVAKNRITWHQSEVRNITDLGDELRLHLDDGSDVAVRRVLCATGFEPHRPGGTLVDELVESASLPCASCGYPIVDQALRWHPRIHVTGPLAELELGPAARNIVGARRAGERIVRAIQVSG